MSSSFNVISKEISQLRNEKNQLQKDEQVLRKLIAKVKEQTNALQIERLHLNRQSVLTEEHLAEITGIKKTDVLEQMVKGNFVVEEDQEQS